jgi:hypothetical protein
MRTLRTLSAVAIVAGLILISAIAAHGHTATYPTEVTLHTREIREGNVRFAGRVRSPKAACVAHRNVKLAEINTGLWVQSETNAEGKYAFVLVLPTGDWHVKVRGKVLRSDALHDHRCQASTSTTVHVS